MSTINDVSTAESSPRGDPDDGIMMTFPQRLMEILSDESNSDTITWLPHGQSFIIFKKKKFAAEVMPRYFKHGTKFTSFTRKLNRWGFTRITQRGPETGAYFHKYFRKDQPTLCLQMCCENNVKPWTVQHHTPLAASPLTTPLAKPFSPPLQSIPMVASMASTVPTVASLYPQPESSLATRQLLLQQQQLQLQLQQQVMTNKALYLQMMQSRQNNVLLAQQVALSPRASFSAPANVSQQEQPSEQQPSEPSSQHEASRKSGIRRATAA